MKRLSLAGLLLIGLALYSCSSNNSSNTGGSYGGYISNAKVTPTTMDGKVVSPKSDSSANSETASKEENESGIDTKAASDSKGVGEFTSVDIPENIDNDMAAKGEELFQTNCTSCHLTNDQRLVGPGLKDITEIRTPEWILNMITSPMKMTKNDPVAKQLKKELNGVQMTNMGLSKDEAREVLEFLRKNDQS